jgi:hypothetical protein
VLAVVAVTVVIGKKKEASISDCCWFPYFDPSSRATPSRTAAGHRKLSSCLGQATLGIEHQEVGY